MDICITASPLQGVYTPPASKSMAHRAILCAALSKGVSQLENIAFSKDIVATLEAVRTLGAKAEIDGDNLRITGIEQPPREAVIDCGESGSTLRFLIPVAAALGVKTTFLGAGKLPERPITPYLDSLQDKGVVFDYQGMMPFTISGKLTGGKFVIPGNISSQFITGLLLALPLTGEVSEIHITEPFESKPYVHLTLQTLAAFGVEPIELPDGYLIHPGSSFTPAGIRVEGDFSNAAFFMCAGALYGATTGLDLSLSSVQGDRQIVSILRAMGAGYSGEGGLSFFEQPLHGIEADVSDIPDLVPILAVTAAFAKGKTLLYGAARLRIKESDRLAAVTDCLKRLGADITEYDDALEIYGKESLRGGATVPSYNDHRIAMAMAVAGLRCRQPVVIQHAECVEKSYPAFFEDYRNLGGNADVINVG
ncbi:3-phosphoshikimate 1-carboxyvinyltransferase [Candidatus Soleaferrea massiliensis]|uniref:3-phosphoshikimate 1-carboxyvinyltransferase n=1 Tax=Candidatus Soleaferrea massiliensis TaxID=1470354 RepID=UPI00058ED99B|nr:3-phosphoshikimate 1-carboxyvinyltransferase [Candidatus Soleaferrea massiliensis]